MNQKYPKNIFQKNVIKSMALFGLKSLSETTYQKDNSKNSGPGTFHLTENILQKFIYLFSLFHK